MVLSNSFSGSKNKEDRNLLSQIAIDYDSVNEEELQVTHVIRMTILLLVWHKKFQFAIQYHPEAAPGPHDPC